MTHWNNIKFRASSWGNLLTEPVTKAAKEAGELSVTCQKELIKIYNREKYGRKKDILTPAMDKGRQMQSAGIELFSLLEGEIYTENNDVLENSWFIGTPDMFSGEGITKAKQVWDLKNSFELDTFTPKLIEGLDKAYEAQINVYFDLCNCDSGGIVYTLLDAPENVLMGEKRKLLYSMDVISEESPEYLRAAEDLERNLTFKDIDYREKAIKIPVTRNDELIQRMKDKVPALRKWLADFEQKHLNMYSQNAILVG